MTSRFVPRSPADVASLVRAYPLCWLVSGGTEIRHASPLPLLPECGPDGSVVALFGHIARSNPQRAALEGDPRATILSMGPDGYIAPRLVSNPTWGPTWNYAVTRFEVEVRFVPDETDDSLWRLAEALEKGTDDPWTPERMGERYHQLVRHIIAFRASVITTHARFKLGQDEASATFDEIVDHLVDRELAAWMRQSRP